MSFSAVKLISLLCVRAQSLACVRLFATPWTVARQAPLSMGLSWQEYWSGFSFPPPGDLPDQGSSPHLLHWQVDSLQLSHLGSPQITPAPVLNLLVFRNIQLGLKLKLIMRSAQFRVNIFPLLYCNLLFSPFPFIFLIK